MQPRLRSHRIRSLDAVKLAVLLLLVSLLIALLAASYLAQPPVLP